MKAIYFIYMVLFRNISIIHLNEDSNGSSVDMWAAHDSPQDGSGGHSGIWVEADTAVKAVWNLRAAMAKGAK